jgi:transposase-like protein
MGKHFNPLEKEFLICQYKRNTQIKLSDFCTVNNVSDAAFRKWLKQYETGGIEALARADSTVPDVLPEGVDRTEESYKREILRLRIENERLKKNYAVVTNENGEQEYVRLKEKSLKSSSG